MFDDNTKQGGSSAQVPPNLPIGEPEDMFSAMPDPLSEQPTDQMLQSMNPGSAVSSAPVVSADPIEQLEPEATPRPPAVHPEMPTVGSSALEVGMLRPKGTPPALDDLPPDPLAQTVPQPQAEEPTIITAPPVERVATAAKMTSMGESSTGLNDSVPRVPKGEYAIKEPTLSRGIMTIIIIIIVSVILGAGGWFVYKLIQNSSPSSDSFVPAVPVVTESIVTDQNPTDPNSIVAIPEIVGSESLNEQILYGEPTDTDEDGLSDEEEIRGGTDPENPDTDGDGLSDGDEVLIWSTNATNPDSDGDTYEDGAEVKAGYNPNGPGRFAVPPIAEKDANMVAPEESMTTSTDSMDKSDVTLSANIETRLRALANANSCTDTKKEEAMSQTIFLYSVQGITLPVSPGDGYALALDPLHWDVGTPEGQDIYADFLKDLLTQLAVCTG